MRTRNEDAYVLADLDHAARLQGTGIPPASARGLSQRFGVGKKGILLAVADGMGGAPLGDVASRIVIDTLEVAARVGRSGDVLTRATELAHRAVWDAGTAAGQRGRRRMGATLTAVLVRDRHAEIAQVGDSRAYLIRAGAITQITKDQSLTQALVERGVLRPGQGLAAPMSAVLVQAMGQAPRVDVARTSVALRNRDCLLVCSDGLTSQVTDSEILGIVTSSINLEVASQRLVALSNERGGRDNVTVLLAGIGGALPAVNAAEPPSETIRETAPYPFDRR